MMEKADDKKWSLIHTDNGEWISDKKVVFLSKFEISILKVTLAGKGRELHVQHGPDGTFWCYKHEIETYDNTSIEFKPRKLRIKKIVYYENKNNLFRKRSSFQELEDNDR